MEGTATDGDMPQLSSFSFTTLVGSTHEGSIQGFLPEGATHEHSHSVDQIAMTKVAIVL